MTEQVDLDALIVAAESMTPDEIHEHPMAALDKLRALSRELRQERERADYLDSVINREPDWLGTIADLNSALSRAEETIAAIRVARAKHPECDKVPDGISCGWKRAVQDIDATLTEYKGQP